MTIDSHISYHFFTITKEPKEYIIFPDNSFSLCGVADYADVNRLTRAVIDYWLVSTRLGDFITDFRDSSYDRSMLKKTTTDTNESIDSKLVIIRIIVIAEWVVLKCGINEFHKFKPDTAIKHSKPETESLYRGQDFRIIHSLASSIGCSYVIKTEVNGSSTSNPFCRHFIGDISITIQRVS